MTEITAASIKQLRDKTGAGMMDCKKALTENNGDFEASVDWLRKKGLSSAAKKSGRVAAEGLVSVAVEGTKAAIIELNAETDFVARNDKFQTLVQNVANIALTSSVNDVAQLKQAKYIDGSTVEQAITETIAVIGENMNLRRVATLSVTQGVIGSYIHNDVAPNMGKIGVLVALESSAPTDKLKPLARQIAMHVAAAKPDALSTAEVNADALNREKQIFSDQARASGKPESIIEKMVEGRVRKYYEEVVLLEQIFVIDGKSKISQVIEQSSKDLNAEIKLTGFVLYVLGQGIEQEANDFASEVAALAKN